MASFRRLGQLAVFQLLTPPSGRPVGNTGAKDLSATPVGVAGAAPFCPPWLRVMLRISSGMWENKVF